MEQTDILRGLSRSGYQDEDAFLEGTFDNERMKELEAIVDCYLKPGRYVNVEEGIAFIRATINKLCRNSDFWLDNKYTDYEVILALYNKGFKLRRNGQKVTVGVNEKSLQKLRSTANEADREKHR